MTKPALCRTDISLQPFLRASGDSESPIAHAENHREARSKEGTVTVNAKKLYKIIREAPDDQVQHAHQAAVNRLNEFKRIGDQSPVSYLFIHSFDTEMGIL